MVVMSKPVPRAALGLSIASLACAAVASAATLVWSGAFPDPPGLAANEVNVALAEARGWSAVTLALAVPLSLLSLLAARRGSLGGRLAWVGTLAYLVYQYLELATSPPFTALFLVYVAAFACALPALFMGVRSIDLAALPTAFGERVPRRSIAAFALTTCFLLAIAWLQEIGARTLAGSFGWPEGVGQIRHVVHALDLGLQVPLGIATGLLLLRRRPSGLVAAAILLVNSVCMGLALAAMVASGAIASGRSIAEAALFLVLPVVAALLAVKFFSAMRPVLELAGETGAVSADARGVPVA